ncbi:target of Myb protein 1 [Denticeps clupeoides]|uniref:Target of Myb protein 1 n=1 Tax=Denticeps clupeoides TaxID=299321 RepID=A0AAY3ZUG5_9TELE|nr:target of Myb protein 1-like [Denticeps clupeoides]
MDFLIGNPFSSPVGQRIQHATSSALQAEDWGLNMEICDIINETEDGPKDAVRAIKKRIVGNKNFREVMLALTVLETCVKNCGHRFHTHVCSKEFVQDVLVRAILPKNNPPMVLQERVLSIIQAWADAFRNTTSLAGVVCVYEDLRRRGLEFPMTDLDAMSPIHTPHRSAPENQTSSEPPAPHHQPQTPLPPQAAPTSPTEGPVTITPTQRQKLLAEVELVRGNLTVMSEMLNQLTPGECPVSDRELLQQLYTVCKSMQQRVVELVPSVSDEALVGELLVLNDDLNNTFIRYDRFERLNSKQTPSAETPASINLIDLSPLTPSPISQSATAPSNQATPSGTAEDAEFDMFAQTRGSSLAEQRKGVRYEDPRAVEGLAGALDTRLQVTGATPAPQSAVMNDLERWMSMDMPEDVNDADGVTSEEFDKFLQDRAVAADHLPTVTRNSTTSSSAPPASSSQQEMSHDQLFKL